MFRRGRFTLLLAALTGAAGCAPVSHSRLDQGLRSAAAIDCATASAGGLACVTFAPRVTDVIPDSVSSPLMRERIDDALWVGCASGIGGPGCVQRLDGIGTAVSLLPEAGVESGRTLDCLFGDGCATAQRYGPIPVHLMGGYRWPDTKGPVRLVVQFRKSVVDPASPILLATLSEALKVPLRRAGTTPNGNQILVATRELDELEATLLPFELMLRPEVDHAWRDVRAKTAGGFIFPEIRLK